MNYTKMSDFEINHKVLAITSEVKPLGYAHNADKRSAGVVKSNRYHWYDFCNSWADAGPIIQKYGISLHYIGGGHERGGWGADDPSGEKYTYNDNPLRAAMIVFLMMQERPDVA